MKVSTMRPAHGLGIDGGEMGARQQRAHDFGGLAGIDQIVDDQHARALAAAERDDRRRDVLEHLQFALGGVV